VQEEVREFRLGEGDGCVHGGWALACSIRST
jgi:hypothetical protein